MKLVIPPLDPKDVTINVKKVRYKGAKAEKYDIWIDPSNLFVSNTRKTKRGMTRKL